MADNNLMCRDCNTSFIFTDGEQKFYAEKGLAPPKRCKGCRQVRKAQAAPPPTAPAELVFMDEPPLRSSGAHERSFRGRGERRAHKSRGYQYDD